LTTGFATDAAFIIRRNVDPSSGHARDRNLIDKLSGTTQDLFPNTTAAESAYFGSGQVVYNNTQVLLNFGNDGPTNQTGGDFVLEAFKRAPGFFDIVAYTGTGVARTVNHSLGVVPELMIFKARTTNGGAFTADWIVWHKGFAYTHNAILNGTRTPSSIYGSVLTAIPTASGLPLGDEWSSNYSGATYVSYLFATLAGVSKVGSYTGNGASQTINCGFSSGARFFLCKASSTTGSWWVFDSARGILASTDFGLQLNSTAAEVTSADAVDPTSVGIIVNQEATCSINANGVQYIFLAVS
jgi:hypothetical protein